MADGGSHRGQAQGFVARPSCRHRIHREGRGVKKGKASDVVVGQTLRYMGYVQDVLAEEGQSVEGAIIALDDDKGIQRALTVTPNVRFYRYKVHFDLVPA